MTYAYSMSALAFLEGLKNFLADRPEVAALAISLFVNTALFTFYVRARDAHVKSLEAILPLATRLSDILTLAAAKAKARNDSSSPDGIYRSSDSGLRKE